MLVKIFGGRGLCGQLCIIYTHACMHLAMGTSNCKYDYTVVTAQKKKVE